MADIKFLKGSFTDHSVAAECVGGSIGAILGIPCGHPLDTVKVRLQTQDLSSPKYGGSLQCFRDISRQESVFGLFKGMSSPLLTQALVNSVGFGVKRQVLIKIGGEESQQNIFFAGLCAGAAQSFILGPVELSKIRMQNQGIGDQRGMVKNEIYKGSIRAMAKIFKEEGPRGLFRGYSWTFLRESPAWGIYLLTFKEMQELLRKTHADNEVTVGDELIGGGVAGMASWLFTYPQDVIKSRVQADGIGDVNRYAGMLDAVVKIWKEGDSRVFSRGLTVTLVRAFITNAVILTGEKHAYEYLSGK